MILNITHKFADAESDSPPLTRGGQGRPDPAPWDLEVWRLLWGLVAIAVVVLVLLTVHGPAMERAESEREAHAAEVSHGE